MKKATTKRERKYGKKVEDVKEAKPKVRLMVDGYRIVDFKDKKSADEFIKDRIEKAKEKRQKPTSYVFL